MHHIVCDAEDRIRQGSKRLLRDSDIDKKNGAAVFRERIEKQAGLRRAEGNCCDAVRRTGRDAAGEAAAAAGNIDRDTVLLRIGVDHFQQFTN